MPTILEKANGTVLDTEVTPVGVVDQVENEGQGMPLPNVMEWVKRPTGDGDIAEYINHPMNYDGTKEVGQVIRGMTGLLGALNYAIVDIVIGGMKILGRSKKGGVE